MLVFGIWQTNWLWMYCSIFCTSMSALTHKNNTSTIILEICLRPTSFIVGFICAIKTLALETYCESFPQNTQTNHCTEILEALQKKQCNYFWGYSSHNHSQLGLCNNGSRGIIIPKTMCNHNIISRNEMNRLKLVILQSCSILCHIFRKWEYFH